MSVVSYLIKVVGTVSVFGNELPEFIYVLTRVRESHYPVIGISVKAVQLAELAGNEQEPVK